MKNEIIKTSTYLFEDILTQNETILWIGQSTIGKIYTPSKVSKIVSISFWLIYLIAIFYNYDLIYLSALGLFLMISLSEKFDTSYPMSKISYAITPKRILWSFKKKKGRESFSINFKDIKWAEMEDDAIFIRPKDNKAVSFETHNAKSLKKRNKPTIEDIENMAEVYELIESKLNENNSK